MTKIDSNQNINSSRRQSLLRSPSARYAIPRFPIIGKQSNNLARASMVPPEQGLLSPPNQFNKNTTLRGALGAIMPDLYFTGTPCATNSDGNENSRMLANSISSGVIGERINDDVSTVEKNLHRLHIRIHYDEHRNDLIVNIIEGIDSTKKKINVNRNVFLAQHLPMEREEFSNPYVKIYLRPPIDQKLRQTSVQPTTINPIWNEYFKFGVTNETILKTTKTLYFYIYNYAHSSRPECIGEAQLRLTSETLRAQGDLWCTISKQRAVRYILRLKTKDIFLLGR